MGILLILSGCARKIRPARHVFIKEGQGPTIDLSQYKSPQQRPHQDSSLAIALAISGGGARAYNFAMGVLLGLENIASKQSNLLQEVDYISTVSGGSFAAGALIRARFEHNWQHQEKPFLLHDHYDSFIREELRRSYLTPILRSWLNPRTWVTHIDDGDGLEKAINHHLLGYRERKDLNDSTLSRSLLLGDLFVDKDSQHLPVQHPMFVPNSTILSNMVIFPFAPNVIDTFLITGYTHNMREAHQTKAINPYKLPLSVGIKASGSFPIAISNTTLISSYDPKYRFLHLIDGGVSDNIGFRSALDMLAQDEVAKKKILIVIDADGAGQVRSFTHRESGALWFKVLVRLPSSGIDSRRVFRREMIANLCKQVDVTPVFLSFSTLIEDFPFLLPTYEMSYKKSCEKILDRLANDSTELKIQERRELYDLANGVKTKYSIKDYEQRLLTETGKYVVFLKKDLLQEYLKMD